MTPLDDLPKLKIVLNHKAYYKVFSEAHGGYPIIYKGRQYFSDGWSYSSTDYAGPEWPPPKDVKELLAIQMAYWYTRHERARLELISIRARFDNLKGLQETKSVPLQQVVVTPGFGADGKPKNIREVVNFSPKLFEYTISYLESEVKTANDHLATLKEQENAERPAEDAQLQRGRDSQFDLSEQDDVA